MNQRPQQQRPLPSYIPSSQIQKIIESTPISEEFSDSIRMLVLLENGEQRLITFTLPKEACTIQEILEQVNVPFQSNTNIQVTEANSNGINYIVTVGNVPPLGNEVSKKRGLKVFLFLRYITENIQCYGRIISSLMYLEVIVIQNLTILEIIEQL